MKKVMAGTKFSSFADLASAMGVKPRKVDEARRKAQQEKLCKCAKCGGQMERLGGSNVLICRQEVEKDGKKNVCGNRRILSSDTAKYAEAIFA